MPHCGMIRKLQIRIYSITDLIKGCFVDIVSNYCMLFMHSVITTGQVRGIIILPREEDTIRPIGGNVVLTCETQSLGENVQLSWFDPGWERSPIRIGMHTTLIVHYYCHRLWGNWGNSKKCQYSMLVVSPSCFLNNCSVNITILTILITTYCFQGHGSTHWNECDSLYNWSSVRWCRDVRMQRYDQWWWRKWDHPAYAIWWKIRLCIYYQ